MSRDMGHNRAYVEASGCGVEDRGRAAQRERGCGGLWGVAPACSPVVGQVPGRGFGRVGTPVAKTEIEPGDDQRSGSDSDRRVTRGFDRVGFGCRAGHERSASGTRTVPAPGDLDDPPNTARCRAGDRPTPQTTQDFLCPVRSERNWLGDRQPCQHRAVDHNGCPEHHLK